MSLDQLAKTVLEQLQNTIDSKTIVGEPITSGDTTVVPITKVSFGFGVGGRQETAGKDGSFGGGSGGGATLEPMGFIVITRDDARLIPFHPQLTVWERVITPGNVRMVVEKIKAFMDGRGGGGPNATGRGAGQGGPHGEPSGGPSAK